MVRLTFDEPGVGITVVKLIYTHILEEDSWMRMCDRHFLDWKSRELVGLDFTIFVYVKTSRESLPWIEFERLGDSSILNYDQVYKPKINNNWDFMVQPRDTCYVVSPGLPELVYNGYKLHAYSWGDYPLLKDILVAVHRALPGSRFNSLLLGRYKGGNDTVGWHADDEKLYGATPEIASVSFSYDREFLLKKRPEKSPKGKGSDDQPACK